jgi:transposase
MAKKNKASAVRKLLKQGMSVREIRARIPVSEGYVYTVKKLMRAGVTEVEAPPLELTEEMKELAYKITQGTGRTPPNTSVDAVPNTSVDAVLAERGARYGNFLDHARITQRLKEVAHSFAAHHGKSFDVDQAEALDMIFHKIGRILNGDPNYADSWIDIAGYAKLVADRLEGKSR